MCPGNNTGPNMQNWDWENQVIDGTALCKEWEK